ncbi:MAG TPA: hypothetical protein EYH26_00905 [Pyrodictium sp.]|nr:hypothetical protein [Pyrodictium sp.]
MMKNKLVLQERTTTLLMVVLVLVMFILAMVDRVSETVRILLLVSLILFAVNQFIVSRAR